MTKQQYLPDGVAVARLYVPKDAGEEADLAERLQQIDDALGKPSRRSSG